MTEVGQVVPWLLFAAFGLAVLMLMRTRTTLMGWTLLFVFNVASASLAAFVFGRASGLEEAWISPHHAYVFEYSAWAVLAMIAAIWLAWRPLMNRTRIPRDERRSARETLAWVNASFVYSSLLLGVVASLLYFFVMRVPTLGTVVASFATWTKVAVILAAIHWRLGRGASPLVVCLSLYGPLSLVSSVMSGFSPVSTDLAVPLVLVIAGFRKFNLLSLIKISASAVLLANLMFAWMASRGAIRKGELDQFSIPIRIAKLMDRMADNLNWTNMNAFSVQSLLLERIDMSDLLAMQARHQPTIEPFRYGGTVLDGAFALVPRVLWPSKPRVAGGSEFVGRYTGVLRMETDETSIGVPLQMELYANGGPLWVIAGLSLFAYACARLERMVLSGNRPLHVLLPSIMALIAFGSGVQQIMLVLASAIAGAGAIFALARFIENSAPRFHSRLMGRAAASRPIHRGRPEVGASLATPRWTPKTDH